MRLALQLARHSTNQPLLDAGKFPANLKATTEQVFNLGTIQGARAVHMDRTGSLAEGKLADIVIFDASNPSMICAAEQDPVAAVVRHSNIRDIDTVIIDGSSERRPVVCCPSRQNLKSHSVERSNWLGMTSPKNWFAAAKGSRARSTSLILRRLGRC